jgi:septum formation protein
VEHDASHPGIDDAQLSPGNVRADQWVASLAYLKAVAGAANVKSGPVLGADTVCVVDGQMLGQPADADDARRMLRLMESRDHEVVTGVALVWPGESRREIFVDRAVVSVGEIGEPRIEEYIAAGDWQGKAGAYNLSERIAAGWPITFDGDPSTVMGLPMQALLKRLERIGATVPRTG